jgi:hypothetical protein
MRGGVLTRRVGLGVPAADAQRWPHYARLSLDLSGADLDGTLAAFSNRGKIPHDRF